MKKFFKIVFILNAILLIIKIYNFSYIQINENISFYIFNIGLNCFFIGLSCGWLIKNNKYVAMYTVTEDNKNGSI